MVCFIHGEVMHLLMFEMSENNDLWHSKNLKEKNFRSQNRTNKSLVVITQAGEENLIKRKALPWRN